MFAGQQAVSSTLSRRITGGLAWYSHILCGCLLFYAVSVVFVSSGAESMLIERKVFEDLTSELVTEHTKSKRSSSHPETHEVLRAAGTDPSLLNSPEKPDPGVIIRATPGSVTTIRILLLLQLDYCKYLTVTTLEVLILASMSPWFSMR